MIDFNRNVNKFQSINEITLDKITDRFSFAEDGVTYQVYFPSPNKHNKRLYVSLSGGARGDNSIKFDRWSWKDDLSGNLICIEDPMYSKFPDIFIGWYFGDKNQSYLEPIARFIKKICQIYHFNQIVLLGSSASGFAACYLSQFFSNIIVLALNPQVDISKWKPWTVDRFEAKSGLKLNCMNKSRYSIVDYINNDTNNSFFFYFNLKSSWDRRQAELMCEIPSKENVIVDSNKVFFFSSNDWFDPHTTYLDRWDLQMIEMGMRSLDLNLTKKILLYILKKNAIQYKVQFSDAAKSFFLKVLSNVNLPNYLHFHYFEMKPYCQIRFQDLDPRIHFEITLLDPKNNICDFSFHVEIKNALNLHQIALLDKVLGDNFIKLNGEFLRYKYREKKLFELMVFLKQEFNSLSDKMRNLF